MVGPVLVTVEAPEDGKGVRSTQGRRDGLGTDAAVVGPGLGRGGLGAGGHPRTGRAALTGLGATSGVGHGEGGDEYGYEATRGHSPPSREVKRSRPGRSRLFNIAHSRANFRAPEKS